MMNCENVEDDRIIKKRNKEHRWIVNVIMKKKEKGRDKRSLLV